MEDNPSYDYGTIVQHEGRRYICVVKSRCGLADYMPGTFYGKQVWQILSIEDMTDLTHDNYDQDQIYNLYETMIYKQHKWECYGHVDFCSNKLYNPVGEHGHVTWMNMGQVAATYNCDTSDEDSNKSGTDTDDNKELWYVPGVDETVDGDFAMPACTNYPIMKFKAGKSYEYGSIVYHNKQRWYCYIETWCSVKGYYPGDDSETWKEMKSWEAVDLTKDNYKPDMPYQIGDTVIVLSKKYSCRIMGWCVLKSYYPAGKNGDQAWTFVANVEPENLECYTSITPDTDEGPAWYVPGTNHSVGGEFAVPDCTTYPIMKFKAGEKYKYASVVYHAGWRWYCYVQDWCNSIEYFPGDGTIAWTMMKTWEAQDLSKDDYVAVTNEYAEGDTVVVLSKRFACKVPGWCVLKDYSPVGLFGKSAWKFIENVEPVNMECFDTSKEVDTTEPEKICRSYFVPDYVENNKSYIVGSLVGFKNEIYRCLDTWLCQYEDFAPDREYGWDAWMMLAPFHVQDLTKDNYLINKIYKPQDRIIYHQEVYECVGPSTECSKENPLSKWGMNVWKYINYNEPSFECREGKMYVDDKEIRQTFSNGNQFDTDKKE